MSTIIVDVHGINELSEFVEYLSHRRGVESVVETSNGGISQLKLAYDPNLFNLGQFGRLAEQHGVNVTDTFEFRVLPFTGLSSADDAAVIESQIDKTIGVLDSVVNVAAGLIFVAFDTTKVTLKELMLIASGFGVVFVDHFHDEHVHDDHDSHEGHDHSAHDEHGHDSHEGHDHGDEHAGEHQHHHSEAPKFLPSWARNNWSWVQIGLAGLFLLLGVISFTFLPSIPLVGIVLCLFAYWFAGADVAKHALPALLRGKFDTDVLMVLAAIGAALLGAWSEGAFLLFLFALGHAGEDLALDKARNAINELRRLMPDEANVKHGDHYHMTPIGKVKVDDVVMVLPGDRIPVDGVIVSGSSTIDQSTITGESAPVTKGVNDTVFTGTVNHTASLEIKVTNVAGDSTLARVVQLVQEAQSQRSVTQQRVSTFTTRFVPAVLVFTLLVMVIPPIFGWLSLTESFYRALTVLVAASPCALAIGTPAAVLSAIAQAARNGVLIKGGIYLEALGTLDAIAFDKTGTLTEGKFSVQDVLSIGVSKKELFTIAGAVESLSNHPLAKAIVDYCTGLQIELPAASGLENLPGLGVRSRLDDKEVLIGSLKMFQTLEEPLEVPRDIEMAVGRYQEAGKTVMVVSYDGSIIGVIALADAPRPNTNTLIAALKRLGIRHVIMLTGDNVEVADKVAADVDIDEYHANLLPEEKLQLIRNLDQKYGAVAMVGDGVNDAPALAATSVGIAMGGIGSGVALETADVVLMDDSIDKLPFVIGLARASQTIVMQNLAIALSVIIFLVGSILFTRLPIGIAVIFHEGSTVLVALNALRLLAYKQR